MASSPTAPALAAMADAGADAVYILTGRRTSELGTAEQAGTSANAVLTSQLDELAAAASLAPRGGTEEARIRAALTRFASYPAGTVDQALLTRADQILRREFGDEAAAERSRARLFAKVAAKERYAHDLLHLVASMSLDIDAKVERELTTLLYEHGIEADELIPLLDAMRKAEAVVWQNDTGLLGGGSKS